MKNNNLDQGLWKWNIENNWFSERNDMWSWMTLCLEVKQVLRHLQSDFQDILVFESTDFWNVLILDGVIQFTERDQHSYQEMLAHTPLSLVNNPENVLIIGWWDGWVLREVLKHESIKQVTLCDIDKDVIEASKDFFPDMPSGFHDSRAKIVVNDGANFIEWVNNTYDSIIVDSSDPIGPAESLFVKGFYQQLEKKLSPKGSIAIQWESLFLHQQLAQELQENMWDIFKYTWYAQVHVPTYPGGNIWLLVCSNSCNPREPLQDPNLKREKQLRYYSPEMHRASFVLPKELEAKLNVQND
jgi:spermidine synthase